MATELAKIIADFKTALSAKLSAGATTGSLLGATDDDGVVLPTGKYFLTIDGDNAQKEHISCQLNGGTKAMTDIKTVARGTAIETSGTLREHRVGASVTITDFAHIKKINDLLDGTTGLDGSNPLKYDADPTLTDDKEFATKKYADDLAIAGSPKATEAVYGISKLSVAAVSAVAPIAVGDNDGRVPTQDENNALVGDNTDIAVGTGNKFVTQTGLQHNAEKYAADNESSDTYVITLDPIPTSYTNGMVVYFYAKTINTGTATLNVNGLGAKTIVKEKDVTLASGDIKAGQLVAVIYDGTNFQMISPVGTAPVTTAPLLTVAFKNGNDSYYLATASGTQNIAHGLGVIPKKIRLNCFTNGNMSNQYVSIYNGTTQSSNGVYFANGTYRNAAGTTLKINGTSENEAEYTTATITFDATNIILTWVKTSSPTGTLYITWEAEA